MRAFLRKVSQQRYLFFMSVPFMIWLVIFAYIPIWGWSMAFQNFKPGKMFWTQEWVGFRFFNELLTDERFLRALRNTVAMSAMGLVAGLIFPVTLALFLNEIRFQKFKRTVQTISYLPHFISWVVVTNMFMRMLSPDNGIVNEILMKMRLTDAPIHFMALPNLFWITLTLITTWKSLGWSTIIYLGAIAGVDQELYEAATADGCGRFRKMWHITLPSIRPTIIILLIISIGNLTRIGFERQLLMGNAMVQDVSEVIELYAIKFGISAARFSLGTAVSVFNSMIALVLFVTANTIFKKFSNQSVF